MSKRRGVAIRLHVDVPGREVATFNNLLVLYQLDEMLYGEVRGIAWDIWDYSDEACRHAIFGTAFTAQVDINCWSHWWPRSAFDQWIARAFDRAAEARPWLIVK